MNFYEIFQAHLKFFSKFGSLIMHIYILYKANSIFLYLLIWALCTSTGAGVWYEPYCGRDTRVDDLGLGQGPNIVLQLAEKSSLVPGEELFFDNLFTSFDLLERLSERGLGGTGTVRQNRLNRVPIVKKKELEKKTVARGTFQTVFNKDQVLVAWKDNKAVYMGSNKYGVNPVSTCSRFNRVERKKVQVPVPAVVQRYNSGMGGVDLLDNLVACYRIPFRNIEELITNNLIIFFHFLSWPRLRFLTQSIFV